MAPLKVPRVSKFIKTESKWWLPGVGEEGNGSYCLKSKECLLGMMKKSGDGVVA